GPKNAVAKYTATQRPVSYFAQSEFYFDCEKRWLDTGCNYEDNAMFQIKWRARLRRLSLPNIASMLSGIGLEILFNLPKYERFKRHQGSFGGPAEGLFGGGVIGQAAFRGVIDFTTRQAENALQSSRNESTKGLGSTLEGPYH